MNGKIIFSLFFSWPLWFVFLFILLLALGTFSTSALPATVGIAALPDAESRGQSWTEYSIDHKFNQPSSIVAGDINNDGRMDVVGAAFGENLSWWESINEDGSQWTKHTVFQDSQNVMSVVIADINGDQKLDMVSASLSSDSFVWWENTVGDGTVWAKHVIESNFKGAWSVATADIDGDGDVDVVGAAAEANQVIVWENTAGDGSAWQKQILDSNFSGAYSVMAVDMDQDNDEDVLAAARYSHNISWWENRNGNGSEWTKHVVESSFLSPASVYGADIDGDNDIDVLAATDENHNISWWKNNTGDGLTWTKQTIEGSFDGATSAIAVDVDGDRDLDIVAAAQADNEVAWWENRVGDGSSWEKHTIDRNFEGANAVYTIDMNGDENLDIVGAAPSANDITWWQNPLPQGPNLQRIVNPTADCTYLVEWTASANATTYILEVSDDASFSNPSSAYNGPETQYIASNRPKGTWYYRVRAANEAGSSPWSIIRFTTVAVACKMSGPVYLPVALKQPRPTLTPIPTVTVPPTALPCLTVEQEPNNTSAQALERLPLCKGIALTGTHPNQNEEFDIYRLEVEESGTIIIDLTNIPPNANYDLYLYNNINNQSIARSENQNNENEQIRHSVSPGRYYLNVVAEGNQRSNDPYLLKWNLK